MAVLSTKTKPAGETLAQEAARLREFLEEVIDAKAVPSLQLVDRTRKAAAPISAETAALLLDLFRHVARGEAYHRLPDDAELSTQQAAAQLNVSRPYLIGLLEKRLIPFRKVGNRRRVLAADLARYQRKEAEERAKVLAELAEQGQELDMGY